ncbi:winged helix-turn-helix domain-containing protein [Undibacterium terreum]|nr:winged helix-turn-helix domain-containing protein [Undibacterium terreum]
MSSPHKSAALIAGDDGYVYLGQEILALPPKEQAVLHLLLSSSPSVVSKDSFAERVWPEHGMSDESLTRCIHRLRQILRDIGEPAKDIRIESSYGRGYRLELPQSPSKASAASGHQRLLSAAQGSPQLTEALMFARNLYLQRTPASLAQAGKILRETIEQAPGYAPARVALAECLAGGNSWGVATEINLIQEGLQHLDTAEQFAPEVAGLHSARAYLLDRTWRFRESRTAFERALRDNPHDADTNFHYGWHLLATGQAGAASLALQQAVRLHPYSVLLRVTLARAYAHVGDMDGALREAQAACELSPGNDMAELYLLAFRAFLQPQEALVELVEHAWKLALSPSAMTLAPSILSYVLAKAGKEDEALEIIAICTNCGKGNACIHAMHAASLLVLNRPDHAMALVQSAAEAHCGLLPVLLHDPANAELRQHPDYATLYQRVFNDL